jgi:hypothetical protein
MSEIPPEILVVGGNADSLPMQLAQLRGIGTVTAVMPPRLALLRMAADLEPPPLDGVVYLHTAEDVDALANDSALPDDLTADEQLFVDAWRARFAPKQRAGDGLAWDTTGFESPDRR